ncbi:MAG: hypothetical protein ACYC27_03720 [Armatimonadota bacterium]
MGWWEHEESVLVGDGPLDILDKALQQIADDYKEDAERNPTVKELAKTLEIAIKARQDILFGELKSMEVSDVTIKMKKIPKKQSYQIGDYIAVPLRSGGYGYARIMDEFGSIGMLFLLLNIYSEEILPAETVRKATAFHELLSVRKNVENGKYRVLGSPVEPIIIPNRNVKEASIEFDRQFDRLGGASSSAVIEIDLEENLRKKGRIK